MSPATNGTLKGVQRNPAEPPSLGARELQVERALARLNSIPGSLEKYTYITGLRARNEDVYYGLIGAAPKLVMVSFSFFVFLESKLPTNSR
jgi:malate dehydrogenase (oxaloacetate-decarboxylating)(NADP+)